MDERAPQLSRAGTYAVRRLVAVIAIGALAWWQGPAALDAATGGRDRPTLNLDLPDVPNPFDEVTTALEADTAATVPTVTTDGPNPYGLAGEDLGRPAESPEEVLAWRILQRQHSGIVGDPDPETDTEAECVVTHAFEQLPEQARQVLGYYGRPDIQTVELYVEALREGQAACT